jgi:hypothetical protein
MRVLLDGLSPVPSDRPTAAEFCDRLTAVDLTGGAQAASSAASTTGAKPKRRLALVLVAATVLSLLLLVLGASGFTCTRSTAV